MKIFDINQIQKTFKRFNESVHINKEFRLFYTSPNYYVLHGTDQFKPSRSQRCTPAVFSVLNLFESHCLEMLTSD